MLKTRILNLIFFSLVSVLATAQIGLEIDTLHTVVTDESDIVAHNFFYNEIPQQKTFRWILNPIEQPDVWEFFVCDNNTCYTPAVTMAEVDLGPNGNSVLDLHLNTKTQLEGYAFVEIELLHVNSPSTNKFAYFVFDSELTDTEEPISLEFDIYPNPSRGLFYIGDKTDQISEMKVYDLSGREIKSITMGKKEWVDLTSLVEGSYMFRFFNASGAPISTKMVSKVN